MKVTSRHVGKDLSGSMRLIGEEEDDMYHFYHLIAVGDRISTTSTRKITTTSATGSVNSHKTSVRLTLEVTDIAYDRDTGSLRISGRNVSEHEHVRLGAHHTAELALNQSFELTKDRWDAVYLDRIAAATDISAHADVAAVLLHSGLCNVCLLSGQRTVIKQRIELAIPRKRNANATSTHGALSTSLSSSHDAAVKRFFTIIAESISRHIDFGVVKLVMIASPGFLKDDFFDFLLAFAQTNNVRAVLDNRSKFALIHSSSGHKHALTELLADAQVQSRLADTKSFRDNARLNEFFSLLSTDADRAYYGYEHVTKANDLRAVETLLLTDELFRSKTYAQRDEYVRLADSVKSNGGDVIVFSSAHPSGEQLAQISGVAAILRFQVDEHTLQATEQEAQTEE